MEEWFADVSKKNPNTKMIFKEEELTKLEKRRSWVDEWFADVTKKNPNTTMIFKEEELAQTRETPKRCQQEESQHKDDVQRRGVD